LTHDESPAYHSFNHKNDASMPKQKAHKFKFGQDLTSWPTHLQW